MNTPEQLTLHTDPVRTTTAERYSHREAADAIRRIESELGARIEAMDAHKDGWTLHVSRPAPPPTP